MPTYLSGSQCQYCSPCKGHLLPGPESSIVSLNTVGLSRGVETDPGISVGFPAKGLPPPPLPSTLTWARPHMGTHSRPRPRCTVAPQEDQCRLRHCLGEAEAESTPKLKKSAVCGVQYVVRSRRKAAQPGPPLGDSGGQSQERTSLLQRRVDFPRSSTGRSSSGLPEPFARPEPSHRASQTTP